MCCKQIIIYLKQNLSLGGAQRLRNLIKHRSVLNVKTKYSHSDQLIQATGNREIKGTAAQDSL